MKKPTGLVLWVTALLAVLSIADSKDLSITTILQDPYIISKGSELEGYCIDLIAELSKKLGFTYKVHLVKDNRYGAKDESGRWTGMIGELINKEADLAVAPLTLTATRETVVEMTTPFMQTGIGFILAKDLATEDSRFNFTAPFSSQTWVGLLLTFLVTGLCLHLIARISPGEWAEPDIEQHSFSLCHCFWYITGALTLQGAGPHPKSVSGRIVGAIWWVFGLLFLACYFANFNTMLNADTKQVTIKSFLDLANQDVIDYGTVEASSTMALFKNSNNPVYRRIYEHMERKKSYVSSMEEGIRRAKEGKFAFIGEAVSLDLAVARDCNLMHSEEAIAMRGYSIAAPLGFPMIKNLTVAILQLSESGELAYLRDKWWSNRCAGVGGPQTTRGLEPHTLRGLFMLMALGLGLGLLLALLELLNKARSQASDSKTSCCSVLSTEFRQRFGCGGDASTCQENEKI
ncbi:putative glutamate receptor [Aplochiton taeniatus]